MLTTTSTALSYVAQGFADLTGRCPNPLLFDARPVPGLPDRAMPLDELRDLVVTAGFGPHITDTLWRQLASHVRDPQWPDEWLFAAAGIALPGLTKMAVALSNARPDSIEDIDSEILAGFLGALKEAPLEPPRLWLRLRWAAWRAAVSVIEPQDTEELPDDIPTGSRSPQLPFGHPDLVLWRAAAAGIISKEAAELISVTRLGGVLVEQLAAQRGLSGPALRMRRKRAERRVAVALGRPDLAKTRTEPDTASDRTDTGPLPENGEHALSSSIVPGQAVTGFGEFVEADNQDLCGARHLRRARPVGQTTRQAQPTGLAMATAY